MAEVSEEALANDTKPKTERGGGDWEEGLGGGGDGGQCDCVHQDLVSLPYSRAHIR